MRGGEIRCIYMYVSGIDVQYISRGWGRTGALVKLVYGTKLRADDDLGGTIGGGGGGSVEVK